MEIRRGNIFESETQALINPVNIEGVMGKGLAYQFKKNIQIILKSISKPV